MSSEDNDISSKEIRGSNKVASPDFENIDPVTKNEFMRLNDFPHESPQNPMGEMINSIFQNMAGPKKPKKLTLSGPVGDSNINIEITDSFTASMAHDVINKIMKDKQINGPPEKSEQDIFEAMMKDSRKKDESKLLD